MNDPQPDPLWGALRQRLGTTARIQRDGDAIEASLIEVEPLRAGQERSFRRLPFAAVFCAQGQQPLCNQGTYRIAFGDLDLDLFVVPIGPGPDGGMRYEAIFN